MATGPQPPLMARAGRAVAEQALAMLAGSGPVSTTRVLVLAGPGNNGGDALVAARHLRADGCSVTLLLAGDATRLPSDAREALDQWLGSGGIVADRWPDATPHLIIDGLLGIGIRRPPEGAIADLIRLSNACGAPILAIDVPSGLDADTGVAFEPVVRASYTITFLGDKIGLHCADGLACAGTVVSDWLGCETLAGEP